jgi:Icc protein
MHQQTSNLASSTEWLAQISDTHLYADTSKKLGGVNTTESLQQVLTHIKSQHPEIIATLATGDLADDASPQAYQRLANLLDQLGHPVYALPGNHDEPAMQQEHLQSQHISNPGNVQLAHWQIILLDSVIPGEPGGHLAAPALAQLEQALQTSDKYTLIALHHQPVPVGSRWIDTMALDNADAFFNLLSTFAQVRGIVWGHVHQSFQTQHQGIQLLACPSTCVQLTPDVDDFSLDNEKPGYRLLGLGADGDIHTSIVRVG